MANIISQLTTSNTFNHWLIATGQLIATANLLTEGNGSTFYANTKLEIGGSASQLNVKTSAGIETLWANTVTAGNIRITGNVTETLNVSSNTNIGGNLAVSGDTAITGNLTVSGNLTLDTIGFDDLSVSGSGSFGERLSVLGNTNLNLVFANTITSNGNVIATSGNGNFARISTSGDAYIGGDLTISGNVTLDTIGFDDLSVAGSGSFGNNLVVLGTTNINVGTANVFTSNIITANTITSNVMIYANNEIVTGNLTANLLTGNANTTIFSAIGQAQADSLAFAIALG